MTTSNGEQELLPTDLLPVGLYVREVCATAGRKPSANESAEQRASQWRVTGRNPDFWWDLVITRPDADAGEVEFNCARCGHTDRAPSMHDVLRLIRAGAHFHDTDPAGAP